MSFISSRPSVGGVLLLVLVCLGIEWATRSGILYLDHELSFGTITMSGSESIVLAVPPSTLFSSVGALSSSLLYSQNPGNPSSENIRVETNAERESSSKPAGRTFRSTNRKRAVGDLGSSHTPVGPLVSFVDRPDVLTFDLDRFQPLEFTARIDCGLRGSHP